jgi:hypothetical protein
VTEQECLADRLREAAQQQQWLVASRLDGRRIRLIMRRPSWVVSLEFTPNGERIRFGEVFHDKHRVDATSSVHRIRRYLQGLPVPPARTLL